MPTTTEEAIDQGISKYMVKYQGLIIAVLLSVIGFFLVRVLSTVEGIAADNVRFSTYVITNDRRMNGLEERVSKVEDDQAKSAKANTELEKKQANDWAEFWKDYGFLFTATGRTRYAKPH
ncbi:hypothetical protein SAMN02745146_0099 [Hymenobacter daecheongensis DSM 21074]|uniref:Uncharacterized protein n=1 Tax=Hymenobacter daecheongensis DSM 21074 TaxID=1121955 RepID=A0A1M6LY60_9BACT|nr:hypothetical protein [Hymenobacter daecheongensis]SHJ76126.1 hypothetical protein SAMN02745146_0099 [Hymenobacter daecheongensis DSM 21074]